MPAKVAISQGFINKKKDDPKNSWDAVDQLNFRKKQIFVRKMCLELTTKKVVPQRKEHSKSLKNANHINEK